jgi:uncharacterized membrane protein YccC
MSGERQPPVAAWFRASRRMLAAELAQGGWLSFGQFRWGDVNLPGALRAGAGMITPLALGLVTGHLEYGVFATLGSLPAGFVSFQGVNRTRVTAVALAAAGMAIATFIGGAAAYSSRWFLVPAVIAFSYLAGLLVTLGQRFMVVGLQCALQLVIASGIPLARGDAAVRAGLVLIGGLWQGALVVASWAVLRGSRERSALASVYRALSGYAAGLCNRPGDGARGNPPSPAFGSDVLRDPNPLLSAQARYRMMLLLEQAERIRVSLAALASYGPECDLLEPAALVIDQLAGALEARRDHRERAAKVERQLEGITLPRDAPWRWAGAHLLAEIRAAVRLLARLDEHDIEPAADALAPGARRRGGWRSDLSAALFTLRAGIGTSTEAGRHALRLAAVAGVAEIIALASGISHGYWIVLTVLIVLRPDYTSTIYRGVQRAAGTVIGAGLGVATALLLHAGTAAVVAAVGVTMTIAYAVFAVNFLLFAVFLTDFVVALLALLGQTAEQTAVARVVGTAIGGALALIGYLAWPTWAGGSAQQKLAQLFDRQGRYASLVLRAYVRPGQIDLTALRAVAAAARRARADAEAYADRLADEPARPPMTAKLAYALTGTARRIAHAALTLHAAVDAPRPGADGQTVAAGQQLGAPARAAAGAPPGLTPADAALTGTGPAIRTAAGDTQAGRAAAGDTQAGRAGRAAGAGDPGHPGPGDQGAGDPGRGDTGRGDTGGRDTVVALVDRFADGVEASAQAIEGSLLALQAPATLPPLREVQLAIYNEVSGSADGSAGGGPSGDGRGGNPAEDAGHRGRLAGPGSVLLSTTDELADAFDSAADILRRHLGGE